MTIKETREKLKTIRNESSRVPSNVKKSGIYMIFVNDLKDVENVYSNSIAFYIGSSKNIYSSFNSFKNNVNSFFKLDNEEIENFKKSDAYFDLIEQFRFYEFLKKSNLTTISLQHVLLEANDSNLMTCEEKWINLTNADLYGFNIPQFLKDSKVIEQKKMFENSNQKELANCFCKMYLNGISFYERIALLNNNDLRYLKENDFLIKMCQNKIKTNLVKELIDEYDKIITFKNKFDSYLICDDTKVEKNNLTAYVDGSYSEKMKKYSSGVIILSSENEVLETIVKSFNDEYIVHKNVSGEVKSACLAIKYALNNESKHITIYYDYEGIEKWADGSWKPKNDLTKKYADFVSEARKKIIIKFVKVKSHAGVFWNERVDFLSRQIFKKIEVKE